MSESEGLLDRLKNQLTFNLPHVVSDETLNEILIDNPMVLRFETVRTLRVRS